MFFAFEHSTLLLVSSLSNANNEGFLVVGFYSKHRSTAANIAKNPVLMNPERTKPSARRQMSPTTYVGTHTDSVHHEIAYLFYRLDPDE